MDSHWFCLSHGVLKQVAVQTQAKKIALIRIAQMDQLRTLLGARATPCGKVGKSFASSH